ncbi:MAG: Endonuclease 4 [Verrucomicrobiae bacterium]|nr:Endonuclease 4 [Verrucomicrobiae bacterium]
MSIAGGVDRAIERGASIGCTAIQIFLKNNFQWTGRPYTPEEITRFHAAVKKTGIAVFAHSGYLINPCAPNPKLRERSLAAIIDEIERATVLGVPFIVMHPGAHLGAGESPGLRLVAKTLDTAFRATKRSPVRIALETTAGQGTCLGHRFEHLAEIIAHSQFPDRLAVCVDTCHIFAAGYDIRTPAGYKSVAKQLAALPVVAFHLNDSKKPLGSRVDRHDHIGKGYLGLAAFRHVLRDRRWRNLPMSLETPKSADLHEDVANLRALTNCLI